jgi:hypothetical protein
VDQLAETSAAIRESEYFTRHQERVAPALDIYAEAVKAYQPEKRLERIWHVYQLAKYR